MSDRSGVAGAPEVHVLLVTGYYDAFSGYQEVTLARALSRYARVTVYAGDRVAPVFTDATLERQGLCRIYSEPVTRDGNVVVHRMPYRKLASLLLSRELTERLRRESADFVLVLGVGQGFSSPSAWWPRDARRATIFGDNRAQWAHQSARRQHVKTQAFRYTKGILYRAVINRCDRVYVNTPDTSSRIAPFAAGKCLELLPLTVDTSTFRTDEADRVARRIALGVHDDRPVLGVVGKASPEKRLEMVLDALQWQDADFHCVMAGLGHDPYSRSLRHRVAEDGKLRGHVTLLGFLSTAELAAVLRAVDFCVWPVQPAITIQQAIASGSRVVLPDNDIVGFLAKDGTHGRTFEEGSLDALAAAIHLEMGEERSPGMRARRAARGDYLGSDAAARRLLHEAGLGGKAGLGTHEERA